MDYMNVIYTLFVQTQSNHFKQVQHFYSHLDAIWSSWTRRTNGTSQTLREEKMYGKIRGENKL